jgi:hypothetical protein
MRLVSREYKVMVDHEAFADRRAALGSLREELNALAGIVGRISAKGDFDEEKDRTILFLDTPDTDLRHGGFVLRRRMEGEKAEYTLKCRSEDRYFASGADLRTVEGFKSDEKLEEDIGPLFACRFSHSNTVRPPKKSALRRGEPPRTLGEAAAFFPVLGGGEHAGRAIPRGTPLRVVNGITAYERVYTGPELVFEGDGPKDGEEKASVALILWSEGEDGRPLVAELSFRLEDKKERFGRGVAKSARSFFEGSQQLGLARPEGTTKTEFIYGDGDGD